MVALTLTAASSQRMPPSQPRASLRSRESTNGNQTAWSTSTLCPPAIRRPKDAADHDAIEKQVKIAPARSLERASEREPGAENFDRIKGEFRIEAALNVAGLPEAMLLAREQEIADRIALAPQRLNHAFCLVRRHDGVLLPLEEDHRLREPIRVIERRALAIARFLLRIWSDQPVEVARLLSRRGLSLIHI